MTITYVTSGNILSDESKAIVIPVNTMGIAGAGLARQWKIQYPDEHHLYGIVCKDKRFNIGEVLACVSVPNRLFLCFPTKIVPQKRSELAWIEERIVRPAYSSSPPCGSSPSRCPLWAAAWAVCPGGMFSR